MYHVEKKLFGDTDLHTLCRAYSRSESRNLFRYEGHEHPELDNMIKELIKDGGGADVNAKNESGGLTPLFLAVRHTFFSLNLVQILMQHGAEPDVQDSENNELLGEVCKRGNFTYLDLLLQHNPTLLLKPFSYGDNFITFVLSLCPDPQTFLMTSTTFRMLEVLKKHGAFSVLNIHHKNDNGVDALFASCFYKDPETTRMILDAGANPMTFGYHTNRVPPILMTCRYGYYEKTRLLLEHGCDPNISDIQGNTPLHSVSTYLQIAELLLAHPDTQKDLENCEGNTALHMAAIYNQKTLLDKLIAFGFNKNARNRCGTTPFAYAVFNKHFVLASHLYLHHHCFAAGEKDYWLDDRLDINMITLHQLVWDRNRINSFFHGAALSSFCLSFSTVNLEEYDLFHELFSFITTILQISGLTGVLKDRMNEWS